MELREIILTTFYLAGPICLTLMLAVFFVELITDTFGSRKKITNRANTTIKLAQCSRCGHASDGTDWIDGGETCPNCKLVGG